ncbi:hypothetical protein DIPPA_18885 [Diplonema papillatum]|nr:hypothetical protein DIPPA_18885 [Diplonema papillatum]
MNRYDHPCGTYTESPGSCCASKKTLLEDFDRGGVGGEAVSGGHERPYTG